MGAEVRGAVGGEVVVAGLVLGEAAREPALQQREPGALAARRQLGRGGVAGAEEAFERWERAGADPVRERDAARRRRAFEARQRAPGAPVGREDAVVIAPAGGGERARRHDGDTGEDAQLDPLPRAGLTQPRAAPRA